MASNGSGSRATGLSAASVELLFRTFARRWNHKWARVNEDAKARSLWLRDLQVLGVGDVQLLVGLDKSTALEWPPCPKEFADLCKPTLADFGLPAPPAAFREAVAEAAKNEGQCWSHGAVRHAALSVGFYELSHLGEKQLRPLFEQAYRLSCEAVMAGVALPAIPKVLVRERQLASVETARREVEKMRKILGVR